MTIPTFVPACSEAEHLPVRMCNELVYCERLFYLEHVQGIFVDSADTIGGRDEHERAAKRGHKSRTRTANAEPPPWPELPRSLDIVSEAWGVRGKIDFLEIEDEQIVVVETKHGRAPQATISHRWYEHELPGGAWPADVAQIGLYMAMLREYGLDVREGRLYYRGSRSTVAVEWSDRLENFLHAVVLRAREVGQQGTPPEPLRDSPKCPGCSLHDICLPDEHWALREQEMPSRRLPVARDESCVVHVTSAGSTVRKDGEALCIVTRDGVETRVLTKDISHLSVFGPSQITAPTFAMLLREGISVSHHTSAGSLLGISSPIATRNVALRRAQYRAADDAERCLQIARALVLAKVRNQRTVLRRQARQQAGGDGDDAQTAIQATLERMQMSLRWAERAATVDVLRGYEGEAARQYFAALPSLLPTEWRSDLSGRTRRPPRDRVNAMLSFAYSILLREAIAAAARVGLDPMLGFFHSMIPGRPALALDLIEPFRPAWADTAVLRLLATGGISRDDFQVAPTGVYLSDAGRRKLIAAHERRSREETTHPRFGYRMSYRRILELEVRVLGKYLLGELQEYAPIWTR